MLGELCNTISDVLLLLCARFLLLNTQHTTTRIVPGLGDEKRGRQEWIYWTLRVRSGGVAPPVTAVGFYDGTPQKGAPTPELAQALPAVPLPFP